jgi:hypothetical protein
MNLLLLNIGKSFHIMLIKNVEALTGFKYCDICRRIVCRKNTKHGDLTFKRHLKLHEKGLVGTKQCLLNNVQKPYCPHILNNKAYAYCLSHDCVEKYKPIESFMTYDFETMENKVNTTSKQTTIMSTLQPLSVAVCVKCDEKIYSKCWDIREPNWLENWMNYMFEEGMNIAKANLLDIPNEVQNNVIVKQKSEKISKRYIVTVLGYNSARFDINLLLPNLSSSFKIKSIVGSGSHTKLLQLKKKGSKVILRFIDAMSLVGGGSLANFVKSFSTNPSKLKGLFPYEAFNNSNYNEVLSKSEPFAKDEFYSTLNETEQEGQSKENHLQKH